MILAVLFATSVAIAPPETAYGSIAETSNTKEIEVASNSLDTESIVRSYFRDIPVMIQVARCESTFRQTLADGSVLRGKADSDDTGVMQINLRYHGVKAASLNLNLNDIYHNMAYARYLYETQGTQPWSASSPCWGKTLAAKI